VAGRHVATGSPRRVHINSSELLALGISSICDFGEQKMVYNEQQVRHVRANGIGRVEWQGVHYHYRI
jgi:hypothetical protein